jgi:hypothetical protein
LGAAAVAGAALGAGYYGSGGYGTYYGSGYGAYASDGYDAYASTDYGTSDGDTYLLRGVAISGSDAVAYCAQQFRSYDVDSRTYLAYSGERVSCPQE